MGKRLMASVCILLALLLCVGCAPKESSSSVPVPSQSEAEAQIPGSVVREDLFVPTGLFEEDAELPRPGELPQPLFLKESLGYSWSVDGDYIFISGGGIDEDGYDSIRFDSPLENMRRAFYTDGFFAVMSNEELAISRDDGTTWNIVDMNIIWPDDVRIQHFEFTTEQDAVLVISQDKEYTDPDNNYAILRTADGGQSWEKQAAFETQQNLNGVTFASPEIGWMTFYAYNYVDNPAVRVYETVDGGANWQLAACPLEEDMRTGLNHLSSYAPHWQDGRWEMEMYLRWWGTWGTTYTFLYNEASGQWQWDRPAWNLPDEVNLPRFVEYMHNIVLPESYSLTDTAAQRQVMQMLYDCEMTNFMQVTGRWSKQFVAEDGGYGGPLSAQDWYDMLAYTYGMEDSSLLDEMLEGRELNTHFYHEHGRDVKVREIRHAGIAPGGNISVAIDIYDDYSTDGPGAEPSEYLYTLQCLFRFLPVEGTQFFTLLAAEKVA